METITNIDDMMTKAREALFLLFVQENYENRKRSLVHRELLSSNDIRRCVNNLSDQSVVNWLARKFSYVWDNDEKKWVKSTQEQEQ